MTSQSETRKYPVTAPTEFERVLFDAGLPVKTSWAKLLESEVAEPVTCDSDWITPDAWNVDLDARRSDDWGDRYPVSWLLGEWYAHLFRDAERILDVGTQDGRPSLFLSKYVPEVVGIDVSGADLAWAIRAAEVGGVTNVRFQVADAHDLPFEDASFDGAALGAAFPYAGTDPRQMLAEIGRVVRPGGVLAFTLPLTFGVGPGDEWAPRWDRRTSVHVEGGRPFIHTCAVGERHPREYRIWLKPDSDLGRRVMEQCRAERTGYGSLRDEVFAHLQACTLPLDAIAEVQFAPEEPCGIQADPKALYDLFCEGGFSQITSWALPDATRFAQTLSEMGVLDRLERDDLQPFLRALARSAFAVEGIRTNFVSCVRA